jgi:hypothetical protein
MEELDMSKSSRVLSGRRSERSAYQRTWETGQEEVGGTRKEDREIYQQKCLCCRRTSNSVSCFLFDDWVFTHTAKKEKALACVLGVEISDIIARTVTMDPPNTLKFMIKRLFSLFQNALYLPSETSKQQHLPYLCGKAEQSHRKRHAYMGVN